GRYEAVYCDLWGCLHDGRAAFPEAVAALRAFRAGGGRVVLVTNSPRPRPAVLRQLARLGVPDDCWDDVATSGDAAQAALAAGAVGRRVWHLGPETDVSFFTDTAEDIAGLDRIERTRFEDAEGIVCTGLFDDAAETPEDYRGRLMLAKQRGLPMLCANPDIVVDFGDRRVWCAGALAEFYVELGGQAFWFGKPHPPIYDLAARRLERLAGGPVEPGRILAIGDGVATDVAGAAGEGIDALFVTGGLAAGDLGAAPEGAAVSAWLAGRNAAPRYAIHRLR
ncbi:MAG: TIGR01459 family HAD-type hydrolase, partial [Gemmobacter sp.]